MTTRTARQALYFRHRCTSNYDESHPSVGGLGERVILQSRVEGPFETPQQYRICGETSMNEINVGPLARTFSARRVPKFFPIEYRIYSAVVPLTVFNDTPPFKEAFKRMSAASVENVRQLASSIAKDENAYRARIGDCALALTVCGDYLLRDPWEEGSPSLLELKIFGPRGKTQDIARNIGVPEWRGAVPDNGLVCVDHKGFAYALDLRKSSLGSLARTRNVLL